MEEILTQAGLSKPEVAAYLYLLDHGEATPPVVARACQLTRSNAYKVLDSLQKLGLVSRQKQKKKFVYTPADPSALASLVAEKRNQVVALEQGVKTAMGQLRAKYRKGAASGIIDTARGMEAIKTAYAEQAEKNEDIYFIKSRADIPFMGYDTMSKLRHLTDGNGITRFGITPDAPEIPANEADDRTDLIRTRIPTDTYTSPIEWSASGDELIILKFDGEGEYIRIRDAEIANSFRQVWRLAKSAAKY